MNVNFLTKQPPAVLYTNGRGTFDQVTIDPMKPCPETHFRCPHPVYCMPVFLHCNDVKDCPYGEDELSCEDVTCQGHYRCRGSSVCLHPSHVCDGWPQCPQRDDELLCNATCPSVCQCQGLALVCNRPFSPTSVPGLKYLDAEGSDIQPKDILHNPYIVYLSLAECNVHSWPTLKLNNLQKLDLSRNQITTIFVQRFLILTNLRFLHLGSNPLSTLVKDSSDVTQTSLRTIDLSYTLMLTFHSLILAKFASVERLNFSFSSLSTLTEETLLYFPMLKHLDLRGCDIKELSTDMFTRLINLQSIQTSDYKLCCKAFLPETFNKKYCFAPEDNSLSCENLFKSKLHRAFVWLIAALCVIGNAGGFTFRCMHQRKQRSRSSLSVYMNSLNLSNSLLGIYLATVGGADSLYSGQYLWHENNWKASTMCTTAGFMFLLSNEVSAFIVSIISADHFIALHFPSVSFCSKGRSAMMASGLAWIGGFLLAAVPLLPFFSHWPFYGRTGICAPLPASHALQSADYLFCVIASVNLALFTLILVAQVCIYWSFQSACTQILTSSNSSPHLLAARRFFSVALSDCLCWFLIGGLGLTAFSGTPVPGQVNVAMTIFVLPLNSALNPFIYAFNTLLEKRREAKEIRILKFLHSHVTISQPRTHSQNR